MYLNIAITIYKNVKQQLIKNSFTNTTFVKAKLAYDRPRCWS